MCLMKVTTNREMGNGTQNSLIFKAVQKVCPQFPESTFTMLFQSLSNSSLSSRFPVWHFWYSEALSPHTCQFYTSSPLKIWVLCGIQSGLICLSISAFSLWPMRKLGWITPVTGHSIWFARGCHVLPRCMSQGGEVAQVRGSPWLENSIHNSLGP